MLKLIFYSALNEKYKSLAAATKNITLALIKVYIYIYIQINKTVWIRIMHTLTKIALAILTLSCTYVSANPNNEVATMQPIFRVSIPSKNIATILVPHRSSDVTARLKETIKNDDHNNFKLIQTFKVSGATPLNNPPIDEYQLPRTIACAIIENNQKIIKEQKIDLIQSDVDFIDNPCQPILNAPADHLVTVYLSTNELHNQKDLDIPKDLNKAVKSVHHIIWRKNPDEKLQGKLLELTVNRKDFCQWNKSKQATSPTVVLYPQNADAMCKIDRKQSRLR